MKSYDAIEDRDESMTTQNSRPPVKAVLFDLDGTLIRAQMNEFVVRYVDSLANRCKDWVKPKKFAPTMGRIIHELIHVTGDGIATNEQRFFSRMKAEVAIEEEPLRGALDDFIKDGLAGLQGLVKPIPLAVSIVEELKGMGVPLVLATNPVFPKVMVEARMAWGELQTGSFVHISSIENSYFCKPQAGYFTAVAEMLGLEPQECLMVGNDINHDLAAVAVGMRAFLVDTWVVDRGEQEWPYDERGDHSALLRYLRQQLS